MGTRFRFAIFSIVTALLCPALAFAAESHPAEGTWSALVFYVVNFLLFLWIVRRFGGSQIKDFFQNRAKTIRETAGRAEQALKDAQDLAARTTAKLQTLAAEKTRIAAEMAEETSYQVKRIEELTRETVVRIGRDAAISVAAARDAGQRRLRESLAVAAGRIARDLVQKNFEPADQTRLLERFVSRLGEEARG
jgi:F-type H+-transporting ATPase subunit b